MSIAGTIAFLLLLIVFLLCQPQEKRPGFLRSVVIVCGGILAVYYVIPAVIGLSLAGFDCVRSAHGQTAYALLGALVLLFVGGLVVAGLLDVVRNRAIRAGSTTAFDKRVRELMEMQNLSYEEAVESATKIRDGR